MKLSTITNDIQGEVIRDAEFETLEYCTSKYDKNFLTYNVLDGKTVLKSKHI